MGLGKGLRLTEIFMFYFLLFFQNFLYCLNFSLYTWITSIFKIFISAIYLIGEDFWHNGRRRGWDYLREQHWNTYITICKTDSQWKSDVWCRAPQASALWQPGGMGWGACWEAGSGEGAHISLWSIHADIWQRPSQYCKVIILQLK